VYINQDLGTVSPNLHYHLASVNAVKSRLYEGSSDKIG